METLANIPLAARRKLSFAYDSSTAVAGVTGGSGGVNINGAEIDLIASIDAGSWNPGGTGTQGETWFNGIGATTTLTSGVANYSFSRAISGADEAVRLLRNTNVIDNDNPNNANSNCGRNAPCFIIILIFWQPMPIKKYKVLSTFTP